eukprot:gene6216-6932_t
MSRKVPLPDGALAMSETGVEQLHEVRPKSSSLSSDEGDPTKMKQGRFFKNLTRSLETPADAPPKNTVLDAYQQYKAKRAFNLHGIVKQQTIDLGTLGSSGSSASQISSSSATQSSSDKAVRKHSTGSSVPESTISHASSKSATAHGNNKGPPPPVAPRKKSVNLPIKESAHHPHHDSSSSYILSAVKRENHAPADTDFQKFRSLTGPSVFRPSKNGPTVAPRIRKITPTLTLQDGHVREEGLKSPQSPVAEVSDSEPSVGGAIEGNGGEKIVVDETGVATSNEKGSEPTDSAEAAKVLVEPEAINHVHELEPVVEKEDEIEVDKKAVSDEKVQEFPKEQQVSEVDSEVVAGETPPKSDEITEVKVECIAKDAGKDETTLTDNPAITVQDVDVESPAVVEDSPPQSSVVVDENEAKNSEEDDKKAVSEVEQEKHEGATEKSQESTEKSQENSGEIDKTDAEIACTKEQPTEASANSPESEEKTMEIKEQIPEDNAEKMLSDAEKVIVQGQSDESKQATTTTQESEEEKSAVTAEEVVEVVGDSVDSNMVESSPVDGENTEGEAVEKSVEEKKFEAECLDATKDESKADDEVGKEVSVENGAVEEETKTVEVVEETKTVEVVEETKVEQSIVVEAEVKESKPKTEDGSDKTPESSSEKLSKMANMLLSFSEDKKDVSETNDKELAEVDAELKQMNTCMEEISEATHPSEAKHPSEAQQSSDVRSEDVGRNVEVEHREPSAEDLDKLENIEAMRKEMENMVNEFNTYL